MDPAPAKPMLPAVAVTDTVLPMPVVCNSPTIDTDVPLIVMLPPLVWSGPSIVTDDELMIVMLPVVG